MKIDKFVIISIAFRKILPSLVVFVCNTLKEKDDKNWWQQFVINKLNENTIRNFPQNGSYEEYINSLDIQACLNLIILNWRNIFIYKFNNKSMFLTYAHLVKDIRNDVDAHYTIGLMNSINDDDIKRYLDAIITFMTLINKDIAEEIRSISTEYEKEIKNITIPNNNTINYNNVNNLKYNENSKTIKNEEVNFLLTKIGKKFFVDYYNYLEDESISTNEIINIVYEDPARKEYTEKSIRSRTSKSRKIIRNGFGRDALINIIDSGKIDDDTKEKADELLD